MSTQPPHNKRKQGMRSSGRNRNSRGNTSGSVQNSQSHSTQVPGIYSNAPFVHAAAVLKGLKVQVVVISNTKYEGIFSTISPNAEIVLELAHMVEGTNAVPNKERVLDKIVIKAKDVVSLTARDVDLEYAVKSDSQAGFLTDADISGKKTNGQAGERELEQWTPSQETSAELSLDGDTNGWSVEDMFKANENKFGYESSYDKSLQDYTTVLRKEDSKEFRLKQERANRLAMEIENSTGFVQRTALELDDGQTEEDRFSAVQRPKARMSPSGQARSESPKANAQLDGNSGTQTKYVPPHLRSNQKPTQRNYNPTSHRPHTPTPGGQRVGGHSQNIPRPSRHTSSDERLTMQDVRMDNRPSQDARPSQDVRISPQDTRLNYEPRSQRSVAQVVAGTNPQHGMVPQQTTIMKQREVKPDSIRTSPSPGPSPNLTKQSSKELTSPIPDSNPHQPIPEDKKTQKSHKSQKIYELNEFSNNFRLQDNQSAGSSNHAGTQANEVNPAPSASQHQSPQPPQVSQPSSQSPQSRPLQAGQTLPQGHSLPAVQPHPQAPITQVIPPQPLPQVSAQKVAQQPSQVLILQQQQQPAHAQTTSPSTRPIEGKKQEFKLNPNAKEFTLNPSAKPFTPSALRGKTSKTPTPPRPHSRQSQSPTLHPQTMQIPQLIPTPGHGPFTVISPHVPQVIYPIIQKKYPKPATNIPPSQRLQQPGEMPAAGQVISVSTATGQPLVAPPHYPVAAYPQHPGPHPNQMISGQPIMQQYVQMQPKQLYRSGHPNQMSNVQQSQAQIHSVPDVSGNTPVFVTPQGQNQVYPGQQQASIYPHHPQSAQQGGQQHPQGQPSHHQIVQSGHPHPHGTPQTVQTGQNQTIGQPHQGQTAQGHRPTPSPVQHSIQSPSQPSQPGLLLYNMPQHSQPIQGHTPQAQQTFTTVLMHQQQQPPQPQPYSATSHSITNMTTVHTNPHSHPHVQPNMMYVGGQTGPPHSHTVMLPSGNIQYLPQQQGGQGQHPQIQPYQPSN